MDTTKWKSVLVPIEVYNELKFYSQDQERTISGQLRIMFKIYQAYLKGELEDLGPQFLNENKK
tara:strand:+ start:19794 stop:19982 length:189 start_codon:yes stop_codon:yes gene_type:complete